MSDAISQLISRIIDDSSAVSMSDRYTAAALLRELGALRKQEPACVIDVNRHGDGVLVAGSLERGIHNLYAAPVPPAAVAVPDVAKLSAEIKRACSYYRQAGRVGSTSQMLAKQNEARADKIIEAALLAAAPAPVAQKVPDNVVRDASGLKDGALYWVRYADTKEMFTDSPQRATAFMLGNHIVTKAGPHRRDEFTGRFEAVEVELPKWSAAAQAQEGK